MTPDSIQYTDWWFSGRLWYVMANGHSGAGGTKEQAMDDARQELERFWARARVKRTALIARYDIEVNRSGGK
jgi:hypothetical protein